MTLFEELQERSQEAKQLSDKMRDLGYYQTAKIYGVESLVWLEAASIAKQHQEKTKKPS